MGKLGKSFPTNVDKLESDIDKALEIFRINYELTPEGGNGFTGVSNKSYAELLEAYNADKLIVAHVSISVMDASAQMTSVAHIEDEQDGTGFQISAYFGPGQCILLHRDTEDIYAIIN